MSFLFVNVLVHKDGNLTVFYLHLTYTLVTWGVLLLLHYNGLNMKYSRDT